MMPPSSRLRRAVVALVGLVLFAAMGWLSLEFASPFWSCALFTLALAWMFVGILGVFFSRGADRAVCSGVALGVFGYLLLVYGPWFHAEVAGHLVSTSALGWVHNKMHGAPAAAPALTAIATTDGSGGLTISPQAATGPQPSADALDDLLSAMPSNAIPLGNTMLAVPSDGASLADVMRAGHSLFAVLAGLFGGSLAGRLWRTYHQPGGAPKRR